MTVKKAVIVDAVRTPIGRYGGVLKDVRPDDMAALVIAELLKRTALDASLIEDVILGCANQAGEDNRNVARMSSLLAGLPVTIAGATVNRLCGSGLMAINDACRAIQVGDGEAIIAGGVESMTRAPFVMAKPTQAYGRGDIKMYDTTLGWRFTNPKLAQMYHPFSMGETAENVAEKMQISRHDQDQFAYTSQQRYANASNYFADEIVPITVPEGKNRTQVISVDEHPRPTTTMADLEQLKPAFRPNGTVTAGNSSGINDGASAVIVMSEQTAKQAGVKPLVRYVASAVAGVDPGYMGLGPIPAVRKALKRAGLPIQEIGLIELNEAFAAQSLACIRELGLDPEIVNVKGGAIALGHPLGASGARILTTLIYEMKRRGIEYGLATMCIGVGQGIATIVQLV